MRLHLSLPLGILFHSVVNFIVRLRVSVTSFTPKKTLRFLRMTNVVKGYRLHIHWYRLPCYRHLDIDVSGVACIRNSAIYDPSLAKSLPSLIVADFVLSSILRISVLRGSSDLSTVPSDRLLFCFVCTLSIKAWDPSHAFEVVQHLINKDIAVGIKEVTLLNVPQVKSPDLGYDFGMQHCYFRHLGTINCRFMAEF